MSSTLSSRWARFASEVAVIVLGVLIALFAESAWTERGERAEERRVLQRLADELAEDSASLAALSAWGVEAERSIDRARAILDSRDTLPGPAQLAHLYAAATVWTLVSPTSTWDELVQAGRLALVEDADVRRLAVAYYDAREQTEGDMNLLGEDPYRRAVVAILPSDFTYGVLTGCLRNPAVPVGNSGANDIWIGAASRADRCELEPAEGVGDWLSLMRARDDLDEALGERAYRLRVQVDQMERTIAAQMALRDRLRTLGYEAAR